MKTRQAVDSLPQFKALTLQSSHLMLSARAHSAKGEPFEAAVRWVEAGRVFSNLAQSLMEEGYTYAATQDFLNGTHCFLQAGDYRPAEVNLEQFDESTQLRAVLAGNRGLSNERRELAGQCDKRRAALQKAQSQALDQMGHPERADKLTVKWLDKVLTDMPGVPEFHWYSARKETARDRSELALKHYRYCCRLRPDYAPYRIFLLERLQAWRLWDEATAEADRAEAKFPNEPMVSFYVAWNKVQLVLHKQAAKRTLQQSAHLFASILGNKQLNGLQNVGVACSLAFCLARMGNLQEADRVLRKAVRVWPSPASDLAWSLLRLAPSRREQHLLKTLPQLSAA